MDESVCTGVVYLFIKLTNTVDKYIGEPIWINTDHITSVYEYPKIVGGSLTTFIHSRIGEAATWEVEESAAKVMKLIEESNAKCEGCSCK